MPCATALAAVRFEKQRAGVNPAPTGECDAHFVGTGILDGPRVWVAVRLYPPDFAALSHPPLGKGCMGRRTEHYRTKLTEKISIKNTNPKDLKIKNLRT